jgi:hypothetical protein
MVSLCDDASNCHLRDDETIATRPDAVESKYCLSGHIWLRLEPSLYFAPREVQPAIDALCRREAVHVTPPPERYRTDIKNFAER